MANNMNPLPASNGEFSVDVSRTGEFKSDEAGIYFEYDSAVSKGRINEAHVLLAFAGLVYRDIEGKRVKVRLLIEEE